MKQSAAKQHAMALILAGAMFQTAAPPRAPGAQASGETQRTIETLLECEPCSAAQHDAVTKLGAAVVPLLGEILRNGPPRERREYYRLRLIDAYQQMKAYEKTNPQAKVGLSEAEYIRIYLDNYVAQYQVRAARTLADIGGPDARKAIDDALQTRLRDDVKASISKDAARIKQR